MEYIFIFVNLILMCFGALFVFGGLLNMIIYMIISVYSTLTVILLALVDQKRSVPNVQRGSKNKSLSVYFWMYVSPKLGTKSFKLDVLSVKFEWSNRLESLRLS